MSRILESRARFKVQRYLGVELPGLGKAGALERRPYGPGVHGMKRKKRSDYTIRLMEKQKVVFHYGLREKQLVNQVKKSKKVKGRAWVDTLVITLEKRLDNVLFRLKFAPSILASRQMVSHGHILVNGKKVTAPGQLLKVGDVVSLTAKGYKSQNYQAAQARPRISEIPACLEATQKGENFEGKMIAEPLATDIPFEFDSRLVTEYYWKVKS